MTEKQIKKYVENVDLYDHMKIDDLITFLNELKKKKIEYVDFRYELDFGSWDIDHINSCIYNDRFIIEFNFYR